MFFIYLFLPPSGHGSCEFPYLVGVALKNVQRGRENNIRVLISCNPQVTDDDLGARELREAVHLGDVETMLYCTSYPDLCNGSEGLLSCSW